MFREEKWNFLQTFCGSKNCVMTAVRLLFAARSMLRAMNNSLYSRRDGCIVSWLNRYKTLPTQMLIKHSGVSLRASLLQTTFCPLQLLPCRWRQHVPPKLHCCTCVQKHTAFTSPPCISENAWDHQQLLLDSLGNLAICWPNMNVHIGC